MIKATNAILIFLAVTLCLQLYALYELSSRPKLEPPVLDPFHNPVLYTPNM